MYTMKLLAIFPFLTSTVCAFNKGSPSSTPIRRGSTKLDLYATVEEAIAEAQRICATDPTGQACKVAWDIVEELEAADSHRGEIRGANQNADLVALMASFDILVKKIDGKMDQLMATTVKFSELGATDPEVEELYARAEDMKNILAHVNEKLRSQI